MGVWVRIPPRLLNLTLAAQPFARPFDSAQGMLGSAMLTTGRSGQAWPCLHADLWHGHFGRGLTGFKPVPQAGEGEERAEQGRIEGPEGDAAVAGV